MNTILLFPLIVTNAVHSFFFFPFVVPLLMTYDADTFVAWILCNIQILLRKRIVSNAKKEKQYFSICEHEQAHRSASVFLPPP